MLEPGSVWPQGVNIGSIFLWSIPAKKSSDVYCTILFSRVSSNLAIQLKYKFSYARFKFGEKREI